MLIFIHGKKETGLEESRKKKEADADANDDDG
jgi:hypothetical protein